MQTFRILLATIVSLATVSRAALAASADPKVETVDLAPAGQWLACAISPHGVHTAVLMKKGGQQVLLLDGVEDPAVDELLPFDNQPFKADRPMNSGLRLPIAFSDDGEHHAYLARNGDEYVAFRDGREFARGKAGATLTALKFAAGANHVSYIESDPALGTRFVVDGKAEAWLQEPPKPVFSADGRRYAYVARKKGESKPTLFVDGAEAAYFGEEPQFTSDSKTLVTVNRTAPNNHVVFVEGKPLCHARHVFHVFVSPFGNQIISTVYGDRGTSIHLKLFDQDVPDTECSSIGGVIFSPDGKRYAALCGYHGFNRNLNMVNEGEFVILDGKRGKVYQHMHNGAESSQDRSRQMWISGGHLRPGSEPFVAPGFSPDSSLFIYLAWTGQQEYVVVNDQASGPYPLGKVRSPVIGGPHVAYLFMDPLRRVVFDGQARDLTYQPEAISFSADGAHWAYSHASVTLDGADLPVNSSPAHYLFTPDGKHLLIVGQTTAAPVTRGLFVDASLVLTRIDSIERPVFTPDSQHFFCIASRGTRPDQEGLLALVDGRPVAAFRELINERDNWAVTADGVLTFVARTGDALKRFRITPPAGDGLAALVATAKASATPPALADLPSSGSPPAPADFVALQPPVNSPAADAASASPAPPAGPSPAPAGLSTPASPPAAEDPVAAAADAAARKAKAQADAAAAKAKAVINGLFKKH